MTNLDDRTQLDQIDQHQTRLSIEQIGSQIQQVWQEAQSLVFPDVFKQAKQIVVAGMGGSILGTDVIRTVFKNELTVPILIAPDYTVPSYVDQSTLVIAASYSGTTAETIAATKDALNKGAMVTAVSSGGTLQEILSDNKLPGLFFNTTFNPSQCARMGLGYSIFSQMVLLARLGYVLIDEATVDSLLTTIAQQQLKLSQPTNQTENPAKLLAFHLIEKLPILLVAEHLEGAAHVFANQLHENAKTYADYRVVPEMNHHLLEGFQFPKNLADMTTVVSINSNLYQPDNQKRLELTGQLIDKYRIDVLTHQVETSTKLTQAWEIILLGAYTAYYISMIHGLDPIPNPEVDWLKTTLKTR